LDRKPSSEHTYDAYKEMKTGAKLSDRQMVFTPLARCLLEFGLSSYLWS